MQYVNALGLVCPKPVIMAKKALKESDEIAIEVDNEISCENLQKMAKVMDLNCQVSQDGNVFRLVMAKKAGGAAGNNGGVQEAAAPIVFGEKASLDSYIVVVSSQYAGAGDNT